MEIPLSGMLIKTYFAYLKWSEGIGPCRDGFRIDNRSIWVGAWKVIGINRYEITNRRFRWDDSVAYKIILASNTKSHEIDLDAFDKHQLLSICMACLNQVVNYFQ